MEDLLGSLTLGPSWVKESTRSSPAPNRKWEEDAEGGDRRDRRGRGPRRDGDRRDREGGRRDARRPGGGGGGRRFREEDGDRRVRAPRIEPEEGVEVRLRPRGLAVDVLAKQILHGARMHSLFDVAKLLLHGRERYELVFTIVPPHDSLVHCPRDGGLWVTEGEALDHLRSSAWLAEFYTEETVEAEPPRGNFTGVARCGMSGELLAPPNFHGYQAQLRRHHRERFSHLPFEAFQAKVRVEQGEEVVETWKQTLTKKRQWKAVAEEELLLTNIEDVQAHFRQHHFEKAFERVERAVLPGDVAAALLSPGLLEVVKRAGSHVRKHPAVLIPEICRELDKRHVPVYKREGKLFTGPARPHALKDNVVLAEKPAQIMQAAGKDEVRTRADLWKAVLPEGSDNPGEEWMRDFLWLIKQGHLLLTHDDQVLVA